MGTAVEDGVGMGMVFTGMIGDGVQSGVISTIVCYHNCEKRSYTISTFTGPELSKSEGNPPTRPPGVAGGQIKVKFHFLRK